MGLLVEASEVLHDAETSPPFLRNTENGGVVGRFCLSNYTESEPFLQRLFHESLVIWFERELFVIHRLVVLEIESVFVRFAPAQVCFRHTDHFSMFLQQL